MTKFYLFLLLSLANYGFCTCPDSFSLKQEGDSIFFTLPGQGSCAVIVKKIQGHNIAVVLDAGVSSTQTHVKFLSNNTLSPFLSPSSLITNNVEIKKNTPTPGKKRGRDNDNEDLNLNASPLVPLTAFRPLSINKVDTPARKTLCNDIITCQKETISVDLGGKLKSLLENLQVTQILVFLSHTDKDHINLISHLPDVPAIFCVGGNVSIHKKPCFNELLGNKKCAYRFDTYTMNLIVNTACGDFLSTLLKDNNQEYLEWFKNPDVLQQLNFLHLWLLNTQQSDTNSQSYIISATLNKYNMSMVFAGDATSATFKALEEELTNRNLPTDDMIRKNINKEHNVLFSVPHHGSSHNFPEQIFKMFKPSAYFVNSGNGGQYAHPHKDLISYLSANADAECIKHFWDHYTLTGESSACTFATTTTGSGKDNKRLPILRRNKPNELLVLGTNISGIIYLDSDGVFSQDFNNNIEIQGIDYTMAYNHHAFSGNLLDQRFCFADWSDCSSQKRGNIYCNADNILYQDGIPYAKIFYSPVSEKWLGYLLSPVQQNNRMNPRYSIKSQENETHDDVSRGLFCENYDTDESCAQLVQPISA